MAAVNGNLAASLFKTCNPQLCFGAQLLSWSNRKRWKLNWVKTLKCLETKGSMWSVSEKKKIALDASLRQAQRMTPTGSDRALLNTTNNGVSLEAQQPHYPLTSQCFVFLRIHLNSRRQKWPTKTKRSKIMWSCHSEGCFILHSSFPNKSQ